MALEYIAVFLMSVVSLSAPRRLLKEIDSGNNFNISPAELVSCHLVNYKAFLMLYILLKIELTKHCLLCLILALRKYPFFIQRICISAILAK